MPFWSVMIPAYNPPEGYLEATLKSVLDQDPGPEEMQIEVVDDCSPAKGTADLVRALGRGRVTYFRRPENGGLAACWNTCIERSRGTWVHILHQDDWVLPGFYGSLRAVIATQPEAGAAFTRYEIRNIDQGSTWTSELERSTPGVLKEWLSRILIKQRIQCPAIVVRSNVYDQLGGFDARLPHLLDYEMWIRIARSYPVLYEPGIRAVFRSHGKSTTCRQTRRGENARDYLNLGRMFSSQQLPQPSPRHFQNFAATLAWQQVRQFWAKKDFAAAWWNCCVWVRTTQLRDVRHKIFKLLFGRFVVQLVQNSK